MVKREPVALKLGEEQWLRLEWGLRSCYTWNDGYSMYRCAAANRKSTKQEMVADLLLFWGCAYKLSKQYIYVAEDKTDCEEEFTETLAQKNREALQLVQESLDRDAKDRLNKRYPSPEQFFEALVAIDKTVILFIDTMAPADVPRYRVYCRGRCQLVSHMEGASEVLRDATKRGEKLCGVAAQVNHFCCLYPVKEQPNFAGPNAIGQFT